MPNTSTSTLVNIRAFTHTFHKEVRGQSQHKTVIECLAKEKFSADPGPQATEVSLLITTSCCEP